MHQHSDIIGVATSINGIPIRLTVERWSHIINGHRELLHMANDVLATIAQPTRILAGNAGEQLAIREITPGKYVVVVYREQNDDGFIITAFVTRRVQSLQRRYQLWP